MMLRKLSKQYFQNKLLALIVILVGTISWSLTMVKSGIVYSYGMGFWGPNGHDGVWHIALIESISKGSFDMPTFAGFKLQNYHIGFDLILAAISRLTAISTGTLYFQIFPPLLALCVGVLTYIFVKKWKSSESAALWSLFFVYFGGSLGWLIGKSESTFWAQQAISTLINPPFAMSLVFILLGLILLIKLQVKFSWVVFIFSSIIFGTLIEIKSYAGVILLGALFVSGVWSLVLRKQKRILLLFVTSLLFSIILFLPLNLNSVSLLVYQPFWFLETMMGSPDRVNWPRFFSAMVNYKSGGFWWKWIPAYFVAFIIFAAGNLGIRLIKDIWIFKKIKNFKEIDYLSILSFSVIGAGILIPLFFIQKGTPWNTIQFFYYSIFFSSILAGISVSEVMLRISKKYKIALSFLLIILTIPTTIITLKEVYLPSRPPAKISIEELSALEFLKSEPHGTVFTYPYDEAKAKEAISNPPRPLYLYDSTAYVSAFASKPVYLEDEVNLSITNYDWSERRLKSLNFLNTLNQDEAKQFLKDNNIVYIYSIKPQEPKIKMSQIGIKRIFENKLVDIYRVE